MFFLALAAAGTFAVLGRIESSAALLHRNHRHHRTHHVVHIRLLTDTSSFFLILATRIVQHGHGSRRRLVNGPRVLNDPLVLGWWRRRRTALVLVKLNLLLNHRNGIIHHPATTTTLIQANL
uniref:(northern house mosquito) hypothetical protein n=1 Tax=Culex pipiens TaxID=7175 RepID=A0A8D8H154_CULPI